MKLKKLMMAALVLGCTKANAQSFAINSTGAAANNSAILDITSTTKGVLVPRVSTAQRTAIVAPAKGLMVYDSTLNQFAYYNGTAWTLLNAGGSSWTVSGSHQYSSVSGNVGVGTTTPVDKLHVVGNVRIDNGKIDVRNTGQSVFIGHDAGLNDDLTNNDNVFVGFEAGRDNTSGFFNVAIGGGSFSKNVSGRANVALGRSALSNSVTGSSNTALGENALTAVTNVNANVAVGSSALRITTGGTNTAVGFATGYNNITGSGNVFLGHQAGFNETGSNKLYIDNTLTSNPLIYGNFTADSLKINGTLTVNNAYTFPSTAGMANQVLQTNGSGQAVWVNPTILAITETDPKVGTLTTGYLPKWDGTSLADGLVYSGASNVGINTPTPTEKLHVRGGNILADRGAAANGVTRKLTLGGARPIAGTAYAQIDFQNYDGNNSNIDYVAASIRSQNESADDGDLRFYTYLDTLAERMIINREGNVGIGTTNPTQAKLVINGSQSQTFASYGYLNRTHPTGTVNSNTNAFDYSIYASDRVAAAEFNAFSDARIKNIKGISNSQNDLQTLLNIEITDYRLKDSIGKGNREYKKVIAQQVEKVYPQAVSKMTDVVPDIYQVAEIKNGTILLATTLKTGDQVKLIFETGEVLATVIAADAKSFTVDENKTGKVFVYGKQVTDFRSVDYEAIGMLHVSATQQLVKELQQQKAQIQQQQQQIDQLISELKKLGQPLPVSPGGAL
jgi:Chaperone of endosialidase